MDEEQRQRLTIEVLGAATTASTRAKWLLPVLALLAALCFAGAILVGVQNHWKLAALIDGGNKIDVPLWFLLVVLLGLGALLVVVAFARIRATNRELREAIARVGNDHS